MIEVILGTLIIVSLTVLVAIIKVKRSKSNICNFNCKNCKEKDICPFLCGINKGEKHGK